MRAKGDAGAATVELLALTLVLVIPLVYLVIAVGRVQAAAYAVESAAYAAARAAVVAGLDALEDGASIAAARVAADAHTRDAVALTLEDFGVHGGARIVLECDAACLDPGTTVAATVAVDVPLPGVPSLVRAWIPLEISLDATGFAPVDGLVS